LEESSNGKVKLAGASEEGQGPRKAVEPMMMMMMMTLNEWKIHSCMSVLKRTLLVDLQQKVSKLFRSISSCPSIIILENTSN
jgi:hypothetical protein